MKTFFLNSLIIIFISILLTSCGGTKSQNVVIINSTKKMYAIGEPLVVFKSSAAMLNYYSPGTIVVFKVDYKILKQQGKSGEVYWIDKDSKLIKIGSIDTATPNKTIVKKYYYQTDITDDGIDFDEIDLK